VSLRLAVFGFASQFPDDNEIAWNDWQGCGKKTLPLKTPNRL
jgi:hypothetical protein